MKKWGVVLLIVMACITVAVAGFSIYQYMQIDDIIYEKSTLQNKNEELDSSNKSLQNDIKNAEDLADSLAVKIDELTDETNGYKDSISLLEQKIGELENKEPEEVDPEIIYVQPPDATLEPSFTYQTLYPDLYVETVMEYEDVKDKTVYITFDDGPSARTDEILEILDEYNIKATFFVVPTASTACEERLKAIAAAGHTIGIHTSSHVYNTIYASVDNFLDDFYKAWSLVYKYTGIKCDIFRFPGGSINSYNRLIYQPLIAEMTRRGFVYYDWNTSGDDSAGQKTAEGIFNMTVQTAGSQKKVVLLLHDNSTKQATVEALPKIIEHFKNKGYSFAALTQKIKPVTYGYRSN